MLHRSGPIAGFVWDIAMLFPWPGTLPRMCVMRRGRGLCVCVCSRACSHDWGGWARRVVVGVLAAETGLVAVVLMAWAQRAALRCLLRNKSFLYAGRGKPSIWLRLWGLGVKLLQGRKPLLFRRVLTAACAARQMRSAILVFCSECCEAGSRTPRADAPVRAASRAACRTSRCPRWSRRSRRSSNPRACCRATRSTGARAAAARGAVRYDRDAARRRTWHAPSCRRRAPRSRSTSRSSPGWRRTM